MHKDPNLVGYWKLDSNGNRLQWIPTRPSRRRLKSWVVVTLGILAVPGLAALHWWALH